MRDYYLEFITNHDEKIQKRSSSQGAKGAKGPFVPFAPLADSESPEIVVESDEEQRIIFEERIAIMMYDGRLSEAEAIDYLTAKSESSSND